MSRNTLSIEDKVTQKRERVPVHESKEILRFRGLDHENFYYRLVRKDADRVQKFLDAGYVFVKKNGTNVGDPKVDTASSPDSLFEISGGLGVKLVLMALERGLWEQDQKTKALKPEELEAGMYAKLQEQSSKSEGNYGSISEWGSKLGRQQ